MIGYLNPWEGAGHQPQPSESKGEKESTIMNRTTRHIIAVGLILSGSSALAETTHSISLNFQEGVIKEDHSPMFDELNDTGTGHRVAEYRLGLNDNFALTAGYFDGDSGRTDWLFDITDSKLVYSGFSLGVDAEMPLSQRNRLFLRAGVNRYDYEVRDDGRRVPGADDNGTGFHVGGGWRYRFDNGMALEVSLLESLNMGSPVEVRTFGVGLSYRFPAK